LINEAKLSVTGRLHTALPALALGCPVFFLNTLQDSRFSLLKYIGLKSNQIDDDTFHKIVEQFENPMMDNEGNIYKNINVLRDRFRTHVKQIAKEVASR